MIGETEVSSLSAAQFAGAIAQAFGSSDPATTDQLEGMLQNWRASKVSDPIERIARAAAEAFEIDFDEMRSPGRTVRGFHARAAATMIAREKLGDVEANWNELARVLNRDHQACMNAHSVARGLAIRNERFAYRLQRLRRIVG